MLSKRAISFVCNYYESLAHGEIQGATVPLLWTPPTSGMFKLNFDGGRASEQGCGWGFVVRNSNGEVAMAGVQRGMGFTGLEVEEARACIFGLKKPLQ